MSKDSLPKYVSLARELKEKIDSGEWAENSSVPTERDIVEIYKVSRSTVRKAILLMTEEGYLRSEHGIGTFVMPGAAREKFHSLHSLSDDIESKGSSAEQQILECTVVEPTAYIREKLGLQTESVMVQKIKRVRYSGITPIGIHTAYLPLINGNQEISVEELMEMKSLYKTISVKWSMVPFEAIESISCRLPSATECQLLEMPMNESVLTCNRTTYSAKYVPMEYVEMIYPSSRYEYKIRINRKSFQP